MNVMKNKSLIFAALLGLTHTASPMEFADGNNSNTSNTQGRQTTSNGNMAFR